jgi:hypothetical protein
MYKIGVNVEVHRVVNKYASKTHYQHQIMETMTMTMTGISPYASSIISFNVTLLATIQHNFVFICNFCEYYGLKIICAFGNKSVSWWIAIIWNYEHLYWQDMRGSHICFGIDDILMGSMSWKNSCVGSLKRLVSTMFVFCIPTSLF